MYNHEKAVKAQEDYCKNSGSPHFAPANGTCRKCKLSIYEEIEHIGGKSSYKTGISVEAAGAGLVTGCPHCNKSYCD